MKKLMFAAAVAASALSVPAFAATDGDLSTTSSVGTVDLDVTSLRWFAFRAWTT